MKKEVEQGAYLSFRQTKFDKLSTACVSIDSWEYRERYDTYTVKEKERERVLVECGSTIPWSVV